MFTKAYARLACAAAVLVLLAAVSSLLVTKVRAQQMAGRITAEIDNGTRSTIPGTRPPLARRGNDTGRMPPETQLRGMGIIFNRSAAQESDLQALIAAQQNPASPFYHQWLTPDEFAARFGINDSDIAKVESWLQEQGFSIDGISRSRNRITFTGTASQVKAAFGVELHYYNVNGEMHYAPSSDLSVPAALAPIVQNVTNLSTFRPKPRLRKPKSNFTSSQSGNHFLTPKDVATIYDINNPVINPAFSSGFTGTGQSIAVVGQTSVALSDIENFQSAAGLTIKDPTLILVPDSGKVVESAGDERESDLDLEYSGGIATGASVYFVYVGDSPNLSVFDSIVYAIDNDVAPIISDSYGICEPALSAGEYSTRNGSFAQAAVQGQSLIVPAGDSGSTDCSGVGGLTTAKQEALAVDFPASSQYVTAMGGSEFPSADVSSTNTTFWQAANGTDVISSALSYIPEQVWNDDFGPSNGNPGMLGSTGGGVSVLTARPSWQTGVPGIPSGNFRLVPDISLTASPNNAGYLYCSSDPGTGVVGSCSNGFRDVNTVNLTVAGGTSFDTPIFAGLVAIINEKENSIGQGVVSPTLYSLASNSTTYASAFHDITSGNNNCSAAGSTLCSGSGLTNYPAGTGYDLASGLGSIDFHKLLSAWPVSTGSAFTASRTTLSPASTSPAIGADDNITITVSSGSGSVTATPTGTLKILVDGANANSSLALSNASATFNFVSSASGSHVITATYSGDSTYAASSATLVVGNQGFRLTATSPNITAGSSGTSTVTITPQEGYIGSISWTISSSPALTNGCFSLPNATVSGSTAVTSTMTINTSSSACGAAAGALMSHSASSATAVLMNETNGRRPKSPRPRAPFGAALATLLFAGVLACRPGKLRVTGCLLLLAVLTIGLPGCGGSSSNNPPGGGPRNVAPGKYTLTVVGTDTSSSSISASTTVSVSVN
jgi:subtilase family serine protease